MNKRMLCMVLILTQTNSVFAQEEIITAEIDWMSELIKGGNTSLALVVLFMMSIFFMVERILSLRTKFIVPAKLSPAVEPLWHKGDFNKILAICKQSPSTLSRMIEYLTHHRAADPGLLIPGAQDIASRELKTHSQKAFSLAVVAGLAPLLGLLGTMIGMIESFKLVEVYGDEGGASMLAGSISKALITTAVGLIIAIPTLGLYHWFKYKINALSETLEERLEFLVNSWLLRGGEEHSNFGDQQQRSTNNYKKNEVTKRQQQEVSQETTQSESEIVFNCVGCELSLTAPSELIGQEVRCTQCDVKQAIPQA